MAEHWLKSPQARDLPLSKVLRMSEDQAYRWFYRARWGDGEPCCAHCGVADAYRLMRNGRRWNRFKCRDCLREFTLTSQTIFADRKLSFRKMLTIVALWVHSVKGKAALQICREAGISYKSAWVMLMKIREALAPAEPPTPLDGIVEIDGAYVGGFQRPDNRAQDRADGRLVENAAPDERQVVTALRQRDHRQFTDHVFNTVTPGESEIFAEDIVRRKVARTAVMVSYEHAAYARLDQLNVAIRIRHADAYAMGPGLNTNGVESFFVRVRRSAIGIHHRVCGTYLELYASSLAWHENTRRQRFSAKWGSGSNGTKTAFQSLNGHGLLARDKCTSLCTLDPSKSQAFGRPSAIRIKGRFSALSNDLNRLLPPISLKRTFGSTATGPPNSGCVFVSYRAVLRGRAFRP